MGRSIFLKWNSGKYTEIDNERTGDRVLGGYDVLEQVWSPPCHLHSSKDLHACQTTVTRSDIFRLYLLTHLLFCVCVVNKCFPLRESWQEVANYCSGCLISTCCAPPAGLAGLETHLNIDQAPGRPAWDLGPLACSRALLIGTEPSCQYHSSTQT